MGRTPPRTSKAALASHSTSTVWWAPPRATVAALASHSRATSTVGWASPRATKAALASHSRAASTVRWAPPRATKAALAPHSRATSTIRWASPRAAKATLATHPRAAAVTPSAVAPALSHQGRINVLGQGRVIHGAANGLRHVRLPLGEGLCHPGLLSLALLCRGYASLTCLSVATLTSSS